jgi:lipoprotein signal peptidase
MLENQQPPAHARRWLLFAAVGVAALALDLATKQWAWDTLRPPAGRPLVVWSEVLEFAFAYNQGTAFGIVDEVGRPLWLLLVAGLMGVWMVWLVRAATTRRPGIVGAAMILAGTLGNLHDRFLRADELGRPGVVDFIKVHYPWGGSWPSFNVADALLVVGVALLLLWGARPEPASKP